MPKNPNEKDEFRALIKAMSRDFSMEANFNEAHASAYKCFVNNDVGLIFLTLSFHIQLKKLSMILSPKAMLNLTSSGFLLLLLNNS
jgi:hypothetical protein